VIECAGGAGFSQRWACRRIRRQMTRNGFI
jgi:hypothetical protein